jgi:hypothetical protein
MSADQTLNHEAVKAYRDHFRFCPKIGLREDIISTVSNLDLWKTVITSWGYLKAGKWVKYSPLNVKGMLSEYERRANASKRSDAVAGNQRTTQAQVGPAGISERSNGRVLPMREGTGIHLRRGSRSLEEILTQALRQNDRS